MSVRKSSIMCIPFTGLGLYGGYRGDKWLKNRLQVFKSFVLPSLTMQTDQDFLVWFQWRPQEKNNKIVRDFVHFIEKVRGLSCIHTFHGITIWDDKLSESDASSKLRTSLRESLPEIAPHVAESDWVYLTCQPSDDMYRLDAVELIRSVEPKVGIAMGWKKGFILNCASKEVAEYNPETTPPFATIVFEKETFINPEKHYRYIGPYKSHEEVSSLFDYTDLGGRGFMVGTHGENISTVWQHPYKGAEILGDDRNSVWIDFGIYHSDPVVVYRGVRLLGRKIINVLPRPIHNFIKVIYHKLRAVHYAIKNG